MKHQVTDPVITREVLDFIKQLCDVPAKSSDTNEVLRWKAAQRDIYIKARELYKQSLGRPNTPKNAAENMGIKVKSED